MRVHELDGRRSEDHQGLPMGALVRVRVRVRPNPNPNPNPKPNSSPSPSPSPNPNPNPNPNQVLDFLRNKRVPFEVVDFAATPEGRQRMAQISGDENSPLPQVQFERQSVSIDRLKDLEDHDELNPQLRRAVRRYAESVGAS